MTVTGTLDHISVAIGTLQAQTAEHAKQTEKLFEKMDELTRSLAGKLTATVSLEERVNRMEPLVDQHERMHQRGRGAAWGVSLLSGGLGGGIVYAILRKAGLVS